MLRYRKDKMVVVHYVKKVGDEISFCGFPHVNTEQYVVAVKEKVTCEKCKRKIINEMPLIIINKDRTFNIPEKYQLSKENRRLTIKTETATYDMEEKTLSELERKQGEKYGMCSYCIASVRKEAIKWVKHYEKIRAGQSDESILFFKDVFTKFHNISEEDLK